MRCSSCEPLLDAYIEASLRPRAAGALAAHIRTCSACAALLEELRVIDALLATARPRSVGADFTATVISATRGSEAPVSRRPRFGAALLLYLGAAWTFVGVVALRAHYLWAVGGSLAASAGRDLAAIGAALRALAPATLLAAAVVTGVLLLDLLLLAGVFYGYRAVRPRLALYLAREQRS